MGFSPVIASQEIVKKYMRYLSTIFKISDPEYAAQFEEQLRKEANFVKGPYLDVIDSFEKGDCLQDLIDKGILPQSFNRINMNLTRTLYKHQQIAIEKVMKGKNIVVSTGTGSGKTESFLIPILREMTFENERGTLCAGVRALIIYPMNALANDQMERLRDILKDYPEITYGSYTGQTQSKYSKALEEFKKLNNGMNPPKNELISREQMIDNPPNILITNYAMLEYLMVRPKENVFFSSDYSGNWKFIILDEAHVYSGSTGIEVSMLLRRLKAKLDNKNIQYILTSATLGGEKDNASVAQFGTDLCSSSFDEKDIIRALRIELTPSDSVKLLNKKVYADMSAIINDDNALRSYVKDNLSIDIKNNLEESLYDLVIKDKNYWSIRRILLGKTKTVLEIAKAINWSEEEVQDFVTVASKFIKNGQKLFDSRYHMFIKATESAFVTLSPSKRLLLNRYEKYIDKGEEFAVFEIVTCSACHSIYLTGTLENDYLKQSAQISDIEKKEIFLLGNSISDEDEDHLLEEEHIKAEEYLICSKCGKVFKETWSDAKKCEHDRKYFVKVFRVRINSESKVLTKCLACENVKVHGVLRSFFTGQEAVTSVLGTALFEALPAVEEIAASKVQDVVSLDFDDMDGFEDFFDEPDNTTEDINKRIEKKFKQFIAFSDSRQAAAYFSSYFNETYTGILYKRLIVEAMKDKVYEVKGRKFEGFIDDLVFQIESRDVLSDKRYDGKKEAYKAILKEIVDNNGVTSLYNTGLVKFEIGSNILPALPKLNLTAEEVTDMCNVILLGMMSDAAIKYDINLNKEEREFFTNNGVEYGYTLSDSNVKTYMRSFIPARENGRNKRFDYVAKIFEGRGMEPEKLKKFLELIWDKILKAKGIIISDGEKYKIDLSQITIRKSKEWYICPKCKKITGFNVKGVCPTFKCDGKLNSIDIEDHFKFNHYYYLYKNLDIRKISVVEHTAQLNRQMAYEYQKDFKQKKINVLSCSTTFEMGVDVGSLETVFMRNMPPSPANYAQRAGRAGRSINSAAYALTFCNKSNHDFTFFRSPEKMIKGEIKPPSFNVSNEKIGIRHLFASALGYFWSKYPEYFSKVSNMMDNDEEGIRKLKDYLFGKPENLKQYLLEFLPKELIIKYGVKEYKWLNQLIGDEGALTKAVNEYKYEVGVLQSAIEEAIKNKNGFEMGRLQQRERVYRDENILSFMSRKNVLPKYGFPVDTVELTVIDKSNNNKMGLELQRDLSMAISEYAPESQIVANGNLITSRYIKKIPNMSWKMYDYKLCECKTLNIEPHIVLEDNERISTCRCCGKDLSTVKTEVFLIPEFGFETDSDSVKKPGLKKPERTYNGEVAYIGYNKEVTFSKGKIGNAVYELGISQGDDMAVLNRSNFYVCESCGYTKLNKLGISSTIKHKHKKSNGYWCNTESIRKYSLGYRFETDVVQLRFLYPGLTEYEQALSVLYAILKGVCMNLNIEQNDIAGCLRYFYNEEMAEGNFAIVLYDKTPGGAGHVRRLNDPKILEQVLKETKSLIEDCDCGGAEGNSSCYSCLRNYYNQKSHDYLKRKYVLEFLREIGI